MKRNGLISLYCADASAGLIVDSNGFSYVFFKKDWDYPEAPKAGQRVVFEGITEGITQAIRVVPKG